MMKPETTRLRIGGMTCTHCDVAVERVLRSFAGVSDVRADYTDASASVTHRQPLDMKALAARLQDEGYVLNPDASFRPKQPRFREAGAALIIVLALVLAARHFGVAGPTIGENMSLGFVFVIGLLASVSSCMAITGGLLVALAAKFNETTPDLTPGQRFVPHLFFNLGRIVSYTFFGAVIGRAGAALTLSPTVTGVTTIAVSILMAGIGLQMLGFLPRLSRILPVLPRSVLHNIHNLTNQGSQAGAFALGAATFFLPCGFTIALQLYVLSKADAGTGALTMLVFALGTLPALLGLSVVSSFARGGLQMRFLTIAGAFVLVLGLMNIQFGIVQLQAGAPAQAAQTAPAGNEQAASTKQVVEMTISGFDYRPNRFVVKADIPVEWRIDARQAEGCGRILISRSLGVQKLLSDTEVTVVNFTPKQPGEYAFNCSMGMMTPNSGFRVTN